MTFIVNDAHRDITYTQALVVSLDKPAK